MADNLISASASAQVLKFKPGGPPATFEVTVNNDSEQFASFQLEIIAAGANPAPGFSWYNLSPGVSAKKPPGDSTKFYVSITDIPVQGWTGIMNLTVRIFSLELRDEERLIVRLVVQEGAGTKLLKLDLPVQNFKVTPGETVEIPVRVLNPNQQATNVILSFLGVDSSWLMGGSEQRFLLDPGEQTEVTFSCQPPVEFTQSPCQIYPFSIEATYHKGSVVLERGTLEVLPTGFVEFSCTPPRQTIPAKRGWWLSRHSEPATYELQFENASNLDSEASVQMEWKSKQKCLLEVTPPNVDLNPGETSTALLVASKPRPRWGMPQKLLLEVTAILSDPRLEVRNDIELLELRVLPVVPVWWQFTGGLLILLLLFWWLLRPFEGHRSSVTSVRFNGIGDRVISGSTDQTLRSWRVKGNHLEPTGVFAQPGKAVRVVRYKPVNNDLVAAGLENGEIQLWNVLGDRKKPIDSFFYQKDDRVLALEFTKDSRYLFSSHGSDLVLAWDIERDLSDNTPGNNKPIATLKSGFAVYDLAVVGQGDKNLAIGGRFNKLVVWNLTSNKVRLVPYRPGGQDDYILSLAVAANKPTLMATADTQGYITLWDMSQCLTKDVKCNVIQEWSGGHAGKPVRSVSLTANGRYLASSGDDGRVMLWPLSGEGRIDPKCPKGKEISQIATKIKDVNLLLDGEDILVVNGSDDSRVRLNRIKESDVVCR
jgi:WD40 repeat protein